MRKPSLIYSISLAMALTATYAARFASATKMNVPPLPHARDLGTKFEEGDDSETIIPPTATRFSRRHDYRQDDKTKKDTDEQAKKDAVDNAKKSQQQQIDAYKQQLQAAIDANNQAVAFGKQGRWEEAIQAHENAARLDPRNKQFLINLSAARCTYGQLRLAKGDATGACGLFRKSLSAAPDNGLAGKCLVAALKKMGYDPSNSDVRIKLGDQLAEAGDLPGAIVEYTAAMQLDPSAKTYIKMGDMSYRYGQIPQAIGWYRQAIVKDAESAPAYRQLGLVQMGQKDFTSAAASLRKALILDSKDVEAGQALVDMWRKQVAANPLLAENHLGLAGAMQLTGDFIGADSEYRKLEALDANNPGLANGRASLTRAIQHAQAEKHKLAADTFYDQGLRREALQEIAQAAQMEPRNARYQFLLGECLESIGDYQHAHEAYLTCVHIDPENNKEAAARIRMMQERGSVNTAQTNQMSAQVANRMSAQKQQQAAPQLVAPPAPPAASMQVVAPPQPPQAQPQRQPQGVPMSDMGMRKNMFEGGNGNGNLPASTQLGFRTHDDNDFVPDLPIAAASAPAAAPSAVPQMAAAAQDPLAKVTDAEGQRDYNTAISLLRDVSTANLQNPEIHHRLAVNLLAAGQISEAISEFRIASALSPTKKAYSDDLAQALAINKQSLSENSNGATGAIK